MCHHVIPDDERLAEAEREHETELEPTADDRHESDEEPEPLAAD